VGNVAGPHDSPVVRFHIPDFFIKLVIHPLSDHGPVDEFKKHPEKNIFKILLLCIA
jgi:hypothetical protein